MPPPRITGARFDALWQQAREPVFLLNRDLRLAFVNRAWEELTGHPAESVLGLACRAHGPTGAGDLADLAGSFRPPDEILEGRPAGSPTLIVHADGERRWRRVEYWPYHESSGRLLCVIGLVRDDGSPPLAPDSEAQRLRAELLEVRRGLQGRYAFEHLIGRGPAHRRLLDQVTAAAALDVPVLIVGEPGTGKRLIARTIHQNGPRGRSPLLPLDCGALTPEDLDRELFGPRPEGSTDLLIEVLELPRDLQARLAGALDGRSRLLATTTGDADRALAEGRLRPDFFYALTTLVVHLKPLRERLDEIPLLAQHLLERINAQGGPQRTGFRPDSIDALVAYDWPGNLRELARVVEAAHGRGDADPIGVDDLPAAIRGHLGASYTPPPSPSPVTPLDQLLTQVERRLIEQAMARAGQNKSKAAELLDISRPRLYRRIKELNLPDEPESADEPAPPAVSRPVAKADPGRAEAS